MRTACTLESCVAVLAALLAMGERRLADAWRKLMQEVFDPYRPELHYMRGPGPKWREKHGVTNRPRGIGIAKRP